MDTEEVTMSQSRYERRDRTKSEKAKLAEESRAEVRKEMKNNHGPHCKVCNRSIKKSQGTIPCAGCKKTIHLSCIEMKIDIRSYCRECTSAAIEAPEGVVDVPKNALYRRTAAQIEENRQRALKILQTKNEEKQRKIQELVSKEQLENQIKEAKVQDLEKEVNQRNEKLLKQIRDLTIKCHPIKIPQQKGTDENPAAMDTNNVNPTVEDNQQHEIAHTSDDEQIEEVSDRAGGQTVGGEEQTLNGLAGDSIAGISIDELITSIETIHEESKVTDPDAAVEEGCEVVDQSSYEESKQDTDLSRRRKPDIEDCEDTAQSRDEEHTITEPDIIDFYKDMDQSLLDDSEEDYSTEYEQSEYVSESESSSSEDEKDITYTMKQKDLQTSKNNVNNDEASGNMDIQSTEAEKGTGNLGSQSPNVTNDTFEKQSLAASPVQNIPTKDESMYFTEDIENKVFCCKLCAHTSTTVGGVKTHITRSHKIQKTLVHPEKLKCKKCMKVITDKAAAAECINCKGMEHYRCTKTGRKHKDDYLNGLPFKCVQCCVPGINLHPETDLRSTVIRKAEEDTDGNTNKEVCNGKRDNDDKETGTELDQMKEDNIKLVAKINQLLEKEKETDQKTQSLCSTNNELRERIKNLEEQNRILSLSKTKNLERCTAAEKKVEVMTIENLKAQEIALEIQKIMTTTVKEANLEVFRKDTEIDKLLKQNERLKAENMTYRELHEKKNTLNNHSVETRRQNNVSNSATKSRNAGTYYDNILIKCGTSDDSRRIVECSGSNVEDDPAIHPSKPITRNEDTDNESTDRKKDKKILSLL